MKEWPDFNDKGDLPPGIHQATLAEVIEHFGKDTPQCGIMARRLEHIYALVTQTGPLALFIILGSFVTSKPDPGDTDIFPLMEDIFDASQLSGERALIFDHVAAQKHGGASIFWLRRLAAPGGEKAAVEYWQLKQDGTKRGIVAVIKK
ncbi:unnamed protein product [marine sediment metagenome]|uniref:Uncharacterized protein n=1 Tax=marine sediment metagenome TaxID=412755 RepID=X1UF26_9ZZZZ